MNYHLAGSDYDPGTRTVTFAPNQMVACIDMNNIIDDRVREGQECFQLVIIVPPGSRLVPGGNANVTIVDGIIPQTSGKQMISVIDYIDNCLYRNIQ